MTATLWIDSGKDLAVELGGTLRAYSLFSEMAKAAGDDYLAEWPALFGVMAQVESQEDADPEWLKELGEEARQFEVEHGGELSAEANRLLETLTLASPAE
jgi:predicted RNase H-like HicB family nuclease